MVVAPQSRPAGARPSGCCSEGAAPPGLIAKAQRNFPTAAAAVFLFDANGRPHFDGLFFPDALT